MNDKYRILEGDNINTLKEIADESVDCIITSPPYYALRDYGTGIWVGGDSNCPHYRTSKKSENTATGHKAMAENGAPVGDAIYKKVCPICGAVRKDDQIGLERTPQEYIDKLVLVFRECRRVLKDDGTLWINIGDSYWGSGSRGFDFTDKFTEASKVQQGSKGTIDLSGVPKLVGNNDGIKNKDLIGIPWMLAFALRQDGWYLRQDIIWAKTNCMPESVHDRCTKSHEYIFLLSKSPKYYFDSNSIKTPLAISSITRAEYGWDTDSPTAGTSGIHTEKMGNRFAPKSGANKRDVWNVGCSTGYSDESGAHYATFPEDLVRPCVLAGCRQGGVILDPFSGTGTTGIVAIKTGRNYIGLELSHKFAEMSKKRLSAEASQMSIFDFITYGE